MTQGFTDTMRLGLHVCRGNWSRQEEVLLTGDCALYLSGTVRLPGA